MKLSNQAMGAIMMALQKSLLEQTDIVPVLQGFNFKVASDETLLVDNPPSFKVDDKNINPNSIENTVTTGSD